MRNRIKRQKLIQLIRQVHWLEKNIIRNGPSKLSQHMDDSISLLTKEKGNLILATIPAVEVKPYIFSPCPIALITLTLSPSSIKSLNPTSTADAALSPVRSYRGTT